MMLALQRWGSNARYWLVRAITDPRKAPCWCGGAPAYPFRFGDEEGWLCKSCGPFVAARIKGVRDAVRKHAPRGPAWERRHGRPVTHG